MGLTPTLHIRRIALSNMRVNPRSKLEQRFTDLWRSYGGDRLEEQHRFHRPEPGEKQRQWRFDYAYISSVGPLRIGIELQGGTWNNGGHVRGSQFAKDAQKYRTAASQGWLVWPLTTDDIHGGEIRKLIDAIDRLEGQFR